MSTPPSSTVTNLARERAYNTLLLQKILSFRSETSPFTLVLDSVEQSANGLVRSIIRGCEISKTYPILVTPSTLSLPFPLSPNQTTKTTTHIPSRRLSPHDLKAKIHAAIASSTSKKILLILHPLPTTLLSSPANKQINLSTYLLSLLSPPPATAPTTKPTPSPPTPPPKQISLLITHHTDIPPPFPQSPYVPTAQTTLSYLATTILILHSPAQVLAKKSAAARSLAEPLFGMGEGREGVVKGLCGGGSSGEGGVVIEMEFRRKSGRGIHSSFFVPYPSPSATVEELWKGVVVLEDWKSYLAAGGKELEGEGEEINEEDIGGTFNLNLTDRQRKVREGVVLPYYDAQSAEEGGMGGRIVYEMGREDDFDEEEDEI
ncbi:MAG: hypothetical protein Q9220_007770 [cf. Caloplaca sp. 1 TL-2023]